jgi:CBS domain-containing protein
MIKITDYMTAPVITVKLDDTVRTAAQKMDKHNIGSLVVVENKKPVGIITERDIIRKVLAKKQDIDTTLVSKIMTKKVETITPQGTLVEVASIMKSHTMRRIVVINNKGEVVGIVTSKDLIDILCT